MRKVYRKIAILIAAAIISAASAKPAKAQQDSVIGYSNNVFTATRTQSSAGAQVGETTLGNLAADALWEYSGADAAIIAGGHFAWNLDSGDISTSDISAVFAEQYEVGVIETTPAQLWQAMVYAVGHTKIGKDERIDADASAFEGFPQISGFTMTYDATQLPENRLKSIVLDDGTVLSKDDDSTVLILAASAEIIRGELGYFMFDDADMISIGTEPGILAAYVSARESISLPSSGRVSAVGTYDNSIANIMSIGSIMPWVILLLILIRLPRNKRRLRNMDGTFSKRFYKLDPGK